MNGVRNVPPMYLRAGQQLRTVARRRCSRRVVFPAALPQILVGLRIALGIAWLVVVAAEMIARRLRARLPHHRLAQRRQALRPGRRRHAADRADRAGARPRHARGVERLQVVPLGVPTDVNVSHAIEARLLAVRSPAGWSPISGAALAGSTSTGRSLLNDRLPRSKRKFNVAYIPVTCHLACPVTDYISATHSTRRALHSAACSRASPRSRKR